MHEKHRNNLIRRITDIGMTTMLLFLMAYQVTGETLHEWIGIGMTMLVIVHQILNRKWYGTLLKGRYRPYRIVTTAVSTLLLLSFALTAFCGMSMSSHAVPFLYGMAPISFARQMHLSMSHWSFVLMGLHLGLHIPALMASMKIAGRKKTLITAAYCCAAGLGLWLFLHSGMMSYMLFRVPFAFLDYDKAGALVILENLLMLMFWAFAGTMCSLLCVRYSRKEKDN